ncbi:MAG: hypothetical protein R2798_05735 [Chitinophagales bacterium]|nr:hypothetical protein [Bacteroidota bacterium]MCB9042582.1 hypothetical protein [Chitinophagales bacterium]
MLLFAASANKSNRNIYIALIALLLLVDLFLLYKYMQIRKEKDITTETVQVLETEKGELLKQYDEIVVELDNMKAANVSLDSSLVVAQKNIEQQKAEIARILNKQGASQKELDHARQLIAGLKASGEDYERQLNALRAENAQLNQTIQVKESEKQVLISEKEQLSQDKADLLETKSKLEETKSQLTTRINKAAVLQADNVSAVGVKYRNSGKELETDNAKKTDKLKICFDLLANKVADSGSKTIYVRIITPEGVPLSLNSQGSGTMQLAETDEMIQYTISGELSYDRKRESYCLFWEQDAPYDEGTYAVEIYHEGYLIGTNNFELKNKLF